MRKFFCISLIILSMSGFTQTINQIKETDIPGINILTTNTFTREDLKIYLGDGTDLYLEYGFNKLFINKYMLVQDTAILEVYMMVTAASAFGIYSMSIPHCIQWNRYGSFFLYQPLPG